MLLSVLHWQRMETKTQIIREIKKRRQVIDYAKRFPLSIAKLWKPHCHRWDGAGKASKRIRGCGNEMRRLSPGVYRCDKCDITEERSSQVEPLFDLGREATLISGGNRAGKTEVGAMFAVAKAAGSKEPWVQQWIKLNGLPADLIQPEPSTVWASALSYADALSYVRPKISKFAPMGSKEKKWRAQDRAMLILPNGGKIVSLSADSGREKYQGAGGDISMIWMDEEHSDKGIFEECMMRCVDHPESAGLILTMTPLKGLTWTYDVFVDQPLEGFKTHKISGLDNPWISSVKLRRAVAHMSQESQISRLHGGFTNQQGQVYPELNHQIHVVDSFEPDPSWPRDLSIDFGVKNPFAALLFAWNPKSDVLHIIDEYTATEKTTLQNGDLLRAKFKRAIGDLRWTVCDPESKDGRLILARNCNLPNKAAPKWMGVNETINLVKQRLALDAEGKPHLIIHRNCKELLKEFRLYRWREKAGKDAPIKRFDHCLDALRYQVAFLSRYLMHQ